MLSVKGDKKYSVDYWKSDAAASGDPDLSQYSDDAARLRKVSSKRQGRFACAILYERTGPGPGDWKEVERLWPSPTASSTSSPSPTASPSTSSTGPNWR